MGENWTCPICGTSVMVRVYRKSLQGKATIPAQDDMTVLAYRCWNGHISLAPDGITEERNRSLSAA